MSRFGAGYAIYGHEYFAHRAGLSKAKIAAIAAGLRPAELTEEERVAYDMAAVWSVSRWPIALICRELRGHSG